MRRIGIFAGVFNPVHTGHIAAALQAIEAAKLDEVVFLPERRPANKQAVEHFGHRVAMLNRAVRPHRKLSVLELVDTSFTVRRTLSQLTRKYPGARLVFIWGSDVVSKLPDWPDADRLIDQTEFVIVRRRGYDKARLAAEISAWPRRPRQVYSFASYASAVTSSQIREALRRRQSQPGLLTSVAQYSNQNWLYVAFS